MDKVKFSTPVVYFKGWDIKSKSLTKMLKVQWVNFSNSSSLIEMN